MKGLMILCKKEVYSCSYVQHTRTMWREGVPQRTLIKSVLCGECVYGKIICAWHNPSLNGKSVDFAQTKTYTAKRIYGELEFFSSDNEIFVHVEA